MTVTPQNLTLPQFAAPWMDPKTGRATEYFYRYMVFLAQFVAAQAGAGISLPDLETFAFLEAGRTPDITDSGQKNLSFLASRDASSAGDNYDFSRSEQLIQNYEFTRSENVTQNLEIGAPARTDQLLHRIADLEKMVMALSRRSGPTRLSELDDVSIHAPVAAGQTLTLSATLIWENS